jgi:rod shape determining protein RodA
MSRRIIPKVDWLVLMIIIVLILIGLINIYSTEFSESVGKHMALKTSFSKQLLWILISVFIFLILVNINAPFYLNFAFTIYVFIALLLIATLFIGKEVSGSRSWISVGGFNLQAAEFAKFATALALAKYLELYGVNISRFRHYFMAFTIIFIPLIFIVLQNDYGSALVFFVFILVLYRQGMPPAFLYFPLWFATLFVADLLINTYWLVFILLIISFFVYMILRKRIRMFIILGIFLLSSLYVFSVDYIFEEVLLPHQRSRINVLMGKEIDLKGSGYNVHQSLIAIGSGGFDGKGFLKGTQTKFNFVPEQNTDFIFCTVAEEYGFLGSFLIVILYLSLIIRILVLSERQKLRFVRIYGYGFASLIFMHFAINIGMTIGLFPVVGIPLPFLSYGGSSIIAFTVLAAIFLNLDANYKHYIV